MGLEQGKDAYYNKDLAKEYRDKAMKELKSEGATFPIKMLMKYNPNVADWEAECIYVEKQLEELLGTDYIDVIVEQGNTQDFLTSVRRAGDYGFMKNNYGCDYADPLTYTSPFNNVNNYQFVYKSEDPKTQAILKEYYAAVKKADAIIDEKKMGERYEAFAEAEAILLKHALTIPVGLSGGYQASKVNPFEGQYAPFGISTQRYKGQKVLEEPMSTDQFNEALAKWEEERAAATK